MTLKIIGMLLVALASFVESIGQVAFKRAATDSGTHGVMAGFHVLTRAPGWIGFGIACFIAEAIIYSFSLRLLDLSLAFPAGSLTFVGVVFFSRLLLAEIVGPRRWAGVGLIILGTILLGAT